MFSKFKNFLQEDKQYFSECKANIATRNNKMFRKGCVIYAFVLLFYTILTIITNQPQILRTMYYVFDAIHICLCLVFFASNKLKKTNEFTIQLYCTCLEVTILSFFVLEGVFVSRTQHSLYIPIAILLILLIFIHRTTYAHVITVLYIFAFALLSYFYKTPEAYINDLYIAIATLFSADIGYTMIALMRHSEGATLIKYERLSQTDQLTGIYNKIAIMKKCENILKDTDRDCLFIILDVDNFKSINDKYGHDIGDEVLRAVSREMKLNFRDTDLIGRFGGDEFIVLMDNCNNIEIMKHRVQKMLVNIENLSFSKNEVKVQCSAGITPKHIDDTIQTIFRRADTALYQAKSDGKGNYKIIE